MADILKFPSERLAPAPSGPHLQGPVRCVGCFNEWQAVLPVGAPVNGLECPRCAAFKGVMMRLVAPEDPVWECPCGNQVFVITRTRCVCVNCGHSQNFGRD